MYNQTKHDLKRIIRQAWSDGYLERQWKHGFCKHVSLPTYLNYAHHGSIRWDRAASIAVFVDMCQPRHLLEVGSFIGLSSNFYLQLLAPWGGHVTSVDPNIPHRCFKKPRDFYHRMNDRHAPRVHTIDAAWSLKGEAVLVHNNVTIPTISPEHFLRRQQQFDLAFIDGDHSETSVLRDFAAVSRVMAPGGCVIFDDVSQEAWPGTWSALQELKRRAVDSRTGTVLFGDQVALYIDRGYFKKLRRESKPSQQG